MVLYGDCPLLRPETLRRLIATQAAGAAAATLLTAEMADPTGYGRVLRDARGGVAEIVEQKAATPEQLAIREANMGIYCFRADLFWKHVGELGTDNPAHEYYLTDMAAIFNRAGYWWKACASTTRARPWASITGWNWPRWTACCATANCAR
jgi:bifunctional UDP-N-acetylglucosamine pyrophosphorylase/glucosamine-1-phosphate N-acetyltransferase